MNGTRRYKILFVGDASNYFRCLAEGLRRLGHEVTVASSGSGWLNTERDIDLSRPFNNKLGGLLLWLKARWLLRKRLAGHDIAVVNGVCFMLQKPKRLARAFDLLKRRNGHIFMSALGTDPYYVEACLSADYLRYNEFMVNGEPSPLFKAKPMWARQWTTPELKSLVSKIYSESEGVLPCLYEYHESCRRVLPPEKVEYSDPTYLNGLNLYAYCNNNPVMYIDPTGEILDTVLDIFFIGWDIYDLCKDEGYKSWENWLALGVDILFAALPFATGGGQVVKIGNKIDNTLDGVKTINKLDNIKDLKRVTAIGESMNRVKIAGNYLNRADDIYKGFKAYNKLERLGKSGRFLAEVIGRAQNAIWLYTKYRTGFTVVDIGFDLLRYPHSTIYKMERAISDIWTYRNLWKWLFHLI